MEKNLLSELLLCILDYCRKNETIFWYEQKNSFYRLYLGPDQHYQEYKSWSENPNGLMDEKFIRETPLSLDFKTDDIRANLDWLKSIKNNLPEKTYKLAFHCLENTDNEFFYAYCFNNFFADPKIEINFTDILKYGDFNNSRYSWSDFVKQLSNTHLNGLLNQPEQLEILSKYLNQNYNIKEKNNFIEPFLKYYQLETINNSSINFANFMHNIFSNEYLEKYGHIPALQKTKKSNDIFKDNDDDKIEKVIASYTLFDTSVYKKLSLQKLKEIITAVVNIYNKDNTLKEYGLLNLESFSDETELTTTFYISLQQDSKFNKSDFKLLLKNTIDIYSSSLKEDKDDKEILNNITIKSIQQWHLNKTLSIKASSHKSLKI